MNLCIIQVKYNIRTRGYNELRPTTAFWKTRPPTCKPMSVIRVTQRARDILEAGFPGLKGFADRFRAAETDYKRAASEKAQTWFSRSALETLIRDEPEALTKRVRDLAGETNLLFLGVPKQGDLALLYADGLNVTELVKQLLELLHGPGDSPARLQRFSDWADERGLPNKWTFPTYLLFLVHPDSEFFVKHDRDL